MTPASAGSVTPDPPPLAQRDHVENCSSSPDAQPSVLAWRGIVESRREEAQPEDTDGWMARLFSPVGDAVEGEREMDARVDVMIRAFLRDPSITSPGAMDALAGPFGDTRLPASPGTPEGYLDWLEAEVVPHAMRVASPRFMGHMTSALPYFVRPLTRLMTAMNQNVVKTETSRVLTYAERQVLARLHRLIYGFADSFYQLHANDPASTLGIVTSGGTIANITALACARNRALGPDGAFRGAEAAGLPAALEHYGWRGAAVIGSAQMHYSFEKAMGLLGLGTDDLFRIPAGTGGRVDLRAMRAAVDHCREQRLRVLALVGVAGSTDAGCVDDLEGIADLAADAGAHYHVDAAWGGPTLFSGRHRGVLAGIERADSVTFDGHKQLYLPMGMGMIFFRDTSLAGTIEKHAHYTIRAGSADLGQRSLEGSRPAVSLLLHAALELIGHKGYGFLMDEGIRKARYLAQAVRDREEFELLADPHLNVVLYRYVPEEWRAELAAGLFPPEGHRHVGAFNQTLQRAQSERAWTFISRTITAATRYGPEQPVAALRAVLANPLTTVEDIDLMLDDQTALGAELSASGAWRTA